MTVLEALPAEKLIAALEKEHWTGRKGYSVRGMWSAFIAGVLGDCHSIAEVARLLAGNRDVRLVCGFSKDNLPGEDALARFLRKLGAHEGLLEECFSSLVEQLRQGLPGFGAKLAVDSTDIEAYANGHRKSPSDPDASWGVKGTTLQTGSKTDSEKPTSAEGKERELYRWFGYKLHLIVDASYELPIAFTVTPANESDTTQLKPLLRKAALDKPGREPQAVMADKGYDSKNNCVVIFKKCHAAPIIPLV
ncbi:MAG: transposase, partial [Chloroflexi bacterium]|nr:transposase [Chloroflexota bacterium]